MIGLRITVKMEDNILTVHIKRFIGYLLGDPLEGWIASGS
jgi:hypothetical protein